MIIHKNPRQRTWVYQELVKQLESAREGENDLTNVTFKDETVVHEAARGDCAKIALDCGMCDEKTYTSSFRILAIATFFCAFSKSLVLIVQKIFFFVCFVLEY